MIKDYGIRSSIIDLLESLSAVIKGRNVPQSILVRELAKKYKFSLEDTLDALKELEDSKMISRMEDSNEKIIKLNESWSPATAEDLRVNFK